MLLAGGASRRMGVDKATLVLDGMTLLERGVRCLETAGAAPVTVATGTPGRLGPLAWPEVGDRAHAGAGPLAGILAALRASPALVVAVLAVDLPDASAAVFRWLRSEWLPGDRALVPIDEDGRAQPLHGLVSAASDVVELVEGRLDAGERRVQRVLSALGARAVPVPPEVAPPGWARNWNRLSIADEGMDPTPGGLGKA